MTRRRVPSPTWSAEPSAARGGPEPGPASRLGGPGSAGHGVRGHGVLRHVVHDLVDGSHEWGTLDRAPSRSTVVQQITLRVYEPGTTLGARRLLHARQSWPVAGALSVVGVVVVLAGLLPAPVVGLIAVAVYGGGFATLEAVSRRARASVRELTASSTCTPLGLVVVGDAARVRATATRLFALDHDLASGRLDRERYEALWLEVYRAL